MATDKNTIQKWMKYGYLFLMAVCLLWYLWSIATFSTPYRTPKWVIVTRCAAAGLAIWLGKLWKDKGFLALAAFFVLMLVRLFFSDGAVAFANQGVRESVFLAVWLFGACYGLARVVKGHDLNRFLTWMLIIWIAGITVYSLIGIYSAWTDQTVYTIGGNAKWVVDYDSARLNPVFNGNTAASLLCVSALILFCAMLGGTNKVLIAAGVPVLMAILLAMTLTDSRAEKLSFALGAGGMTAITAACAAGKHTGHSRHTGTIVGVLCFVLITGGLIWLQFQLWPWFYSLKARGGVLLSAAVAEDVAETTSVQGPFLLVGGRSLFNGREYVWNGVIEYLRTHPMVLFTGASVFNPMAGPNEILYPLYGTNFIHAHNTLLQVLLESGIPGLLLICFFLGLLIVRGSRLMLFENLQFRWMKLLPAAVFAILAGELIECFIVLFRSYTPQQALVFICFGIVCMYGQKEQKAENGLKGALV